MAASPWLAYTASIIVLTLGLPILLIFLPETISVQPSTPNNAPFADHLERASPDITPVGQQQSESDSDSEHKTLSTRLGEVLRDYGFLKDRNILILISSFCLYWLGRSQMDLLVQYTSTRYSQSLASAGLVASMNAIISLILFLLILPGIGSYLQKVRQWSGTLKDLWLLKSSIILLTVGSFIIGAAPTLPLMLLGDAIYILGTGFSPVARGLLTIYVDKLHIARLHALISIGQLLGLLIGSPLLALLFDCGLGIGQEWTGLPFLGSAVLHFLMSFAIWNVRGPANNGTI